MKKPVMNISEVELQERPAAFSPKGTTAERFNARMGLISAHLGAQKLGYNLTSVPPGRRAFPFHNHHVNEEMFFIIEGSGTVRIGDATHPVRKGDIIACPPGGRDTAHQIINTGDRELTYLAISTKLNPEVAEYPDSGKFGVLSNQPVGSNGQSGGFRFISRPEDGLDYWEDE